MNYLQRSRDTLVKLFVLWMQNFAFHLGSIFDILIFVLKCISNLHPIRNILWRVGSTCGEVTYRLY